MTPLVIAALDDAEKLLDKTYKIKKYEICKSYLIKLVLDLKTGKNRKKAVKAVNVYKDIFDYPHAIFDNKMTGECEMLTIGVNSGGGDLKKAKNKTRCGSHSGKSKTRSNKPCGK